MVSLTRSKAYEKGIRQGAPQAIQVADRFHLLQNLSQTLEQVFGTHAEALKEVEKQVCGLKACQDKQSLLYWEFLKRPYLITCVVQLLPNVAFRSDQGLSLLNPYHDYLLSRWNSGYYNTQKLFEEIVMAGYTGSYATVVRFTRYLKNLPGFELGFFAAKFCSRFRV